MADDEFVAVADASSVAEPQVEATTTPDVETPAVVDVATQLAELQANLAAVEKERNDLKSQTIGRQRAADRDLALHDEIGALTRSVSAMMKHMASGQRDTTPLENELRAIEADSEKAQSSQKWTSTYAKASEMLSEAVMDGDRQVLDPKGPELRLAREAWNKAREEGDVEGLFEAVHKANQARMKKERELISNPDSKSSLEMSVSNSNGSGPRLLNDSEIWKAYGRGEVNFNDDVKKAGKALGYL